jgi:hypothetical protein
LMNFPSTKIQGCGINLDDVDIGDVNEERPQKQARKDESSPPPCAEEVEEEEEGDDNKDETTEDEST